ncbi:MAG: EAL domain-containing protein [Geobacteraceae bacterium]|nr:EAL domain-containing protein [Geobacteraceae bacterium]
MSDSVSSCEEPMILIVDDDRFMREAFQEVLREAGFITAMAADGASAVSSFTALQPDLVLLDLNLPVMDGFEACRQIRATVAGKYTPVLMVTGMDETDLIHRAFDAGATDFIAKPVNPELLVYRVRHLLRAGRNMKDLAESEDRLRMLKEAVDCLPIGITLSDVDGRIVYSNPAEAEIHGYRVEELFGREARLFARHDRRKPFPPEQLDNIGVWKRESVNIRKSGEEFPVQLTSIAVRNADGGCIGIVTACEDITGRKEAEKRIYHLAYNDPLTGLPNRGLLLNRLQQAVALASREERKVCLLFLDLDNFKDFNDTQGHDFGDKLLREVAGRLAAGMRESDTLARLGGDEFVVVLTSVTGQECAAAAAQRILSAFSRPFVIDGRQIYSSASIGIALYPDDGLDTESLFKCADTAMYHAKNEGRSHYRFFSAEMNQSIMRRMALENSLRQGLERHEFFLHYQPLWDLKTAAMVGVEVLLRWQSADFGLILPSEFIALTEDTGLIYGMGEWVLRAACIQAGNWAAAGRRGVKMAVNISGKQLTQPDFPAMVARVVRETGIEPGALELEFTESVIMEQPDKISDTLRALKKMGIRLSIDDFGTGYSSLNCLKHFPIDRIKIDRSFVAGLCRDNDDAAIVRAVICMAHSLNMKVLAEGIENSDQLHFLTELGCDEAQGFYLAMPMAAEDLAVILGGTHGKEAAMLPVTEWFDNRPVLAG